jgi:hypothetical protein
MRMASIDERILGFVVERVSHTERGEVLGGQHIALPIESGAVGHIRAGDRSTPPRGHIGSGPVESQPIVEHGTSGWNRTGYGSDITPIRIDIKQCTNGNVIKLPRLVAPWQVKQAAIFERGVVKSYPDGYCVG